MDSVGLFQVSVFFVGFSWFFQVLYSPPVGFCSFACSV